MDTAQSFITHSTQLLERDFLPRIRAVVEMLTDEQVWWRPNEASNSIGNLILHLSGNVNQWIVGGVGKQPVIRERDREFNERSPIPRAELLAKLEGTVSQGCRVLALLNPSTLAEVREIQGNSVTVLEAMYHVVEHFSMHTGQILMLAKMITASDLKLYDFPGGTATKLW
ncbi:MAG: DUF1572 family protein [Bacteroidetes bacterium]|nr:DUF1572 family protein [Bacteroidota bacterium]MCW5896851.1 DUF1572 family protein [Bacteroidota bacterium]